MSEKVPVYDNHFHMSPSGRNIEALREFEAAGGTGITLVTLPYPEVPIRTGSDFSDSFDITYSLAQKARDQTGVEVNVAVGPYPILYLSLLESCGPEKAEEAMVEGMEIAAKAVEEGKAVAIGEIGRPHFPVPKEVWDASNRILQRGMELARDVGCPVIIHCESDGDTMRSLGEIADRARLPRHRVIKHHSEPLVTDSESCGLMPSIPASKSILKEAFAKGTDRFMIETDFIDDPAKPAMMMPPTTVPKKVASWVSGGTVPLESIYKICKDIPDSYYKR
jgi:TatD-related deoxyribonuclease